MPDGFKFNMADRVSFVFWVAGILQRPHHWWECYIHALCVWWLSVRFVLSVVIANQWGGRRGRDHMVVGFTTNYAISAYHHWWCEFESWSGRGEQDYVIKFVSDLQQVGCFLRVLLFSPPIKLTVTL